jgi:glycosyltransferase involved in cell wall biosynthesis
MRLSVVIPTFRRDDSVGRLLVALRAQRGVELEMIVVDQNERGFLASRLGALLDSVRVVRLEQPNVSTARNVGFLASHHEHVLFVDDDLVPEPGFCADGLSRFYEARDVRCLVPVITTTTGVAFARAGYRRKRELVHPSRPSLWQIDWAMSAAFMCERSCYEATGGFDEGLFAYARAAEDQEFFLRMRARGISLWLDSDWVLFHDEHVPGGCEMRSAGYWITREKSVRSWAYRERAHATPPGRLTPSAWVRMWRSALLNRNLIGMSFADARRNATLLVQSIRASERAVPWEERASVTTIDHLDAHRVPARP